MATSRRVSDYSQSAKAVTRSATSALGATMRQKPDVVSIANESIKGQSLLRRTAQKAETAAKITKDTADTDKYVLKNELKVKEKTRDVKRQGQRMTGAVAGLGTLASAAIMRKNSIEDAAERKMLREEEAALALQRQTNHDEMMGKWEELINNQKKLGGTPGVDSSPKPADSSSSSSGETATATGSGTTFQKTKPITTGGAGWSPLGATLKFAEGTHRQGDRAYNTGFGYNMFEDLSRHPDKVFNGVSAAAGAYQFMPGTWNGVSKALGLTDFGPQSQERAGEYLTQRRGVSTDKPFTTVAELKGALDKLAPEWASLPLSSTGKSFYDGDGINSAKSFDSIRRFYEAQVGYTLK